MISQIENFFRKLRRRINRSEWAIRRLKLSTSEETSQEPGLLIIQIDGLARKQLEQAIRRGRMPFLKRLLWHESYELNTFYSGVPSTTPAVQGELHYGVSCAVPAFSYFDRFERKISTMFHPETVKAVDARLKEGTTGLLEGGSSWSNIYTGGAALDESHFCAATISLTDMLRSVSFLGLLGLLLVNLAAVLRVIYVMVVEFFVAIWDVVYGIYQGENPFKEIKFIIARVFVCAGLREVLTVGTKIDLARGLPIIHANFLGYDEQAHRRGPSSTFAHWSLKGIDGAIRQLYWEAMRSTRRDYQVWVFSDHGQETVLSFNEEHGKSIKNVIAQCLDSFSSSWPEQMPWEEALPMQGQRKWPRVHRTGVIEEQGFEVGEGDKRFCITAMGPVGHLYLARTLELEQKRELARILIDQGKVPGVLISTGPDTFEWHHARGVAQMPQEADALLSHPGPLKKAVATDLVRLCTSQAAGDLILVGWTPYGMPWSFPIEQGAHGGPGTDETQGFALLPAKTRLPEEAQDFIRPRHLREAALHLLGRAIIPARGRARTQSNQLRVMTYNVHSCMGMDGRISPQRIVRVVEMMEADIVALQEIDIGRARTRGHDQASIIAQELGMEVCFCPTVINGKEHYGHALLSRFPMEIVQTGQLLAECDASFCKEARGATWIRVKVQDRLITVISTHFGLGRNERLTQMQDLLSERWLGSVGPDEPVILLGDFNMQPDSPPYVEVAKRLRDVQRSVSDFKPLKTFASLHPFTRIDHVFVSSHFRVEKVQVPRYHLTRVASDHLPLVTDLRLIA